jgi:hypothetical protein
VLGTRPSGSASTGSSSHAAVAADAAASALEALNLVGRCSRNGKTKEFAHNARSVSSAPRVLAHRSRLRLPARPHLHGLQGFILRHVTGSSGGPRVSRVARLFMVKDRKAYADQLERLATPPELRRIIVAHHETLSDDPAAVLRRVAASLR